MSSTDQNQASEHRSLKEIMRESFTDAFWESIETWVLQWVEDEYRAVKRIIQGMRYAVLLLVVVLILGLITELLWSSVAIVWLVK
ncbi:MAG: hypothetical protein SV377_06155, partial [Halobacteria archaeon]|nr:hypothetical protein [Halobacteria archaeon]